MPSRDERQRTAGDRSALAGELVRTHVLELLADRWHVPLTTIVAGPGFGKSTALAQAARLDRAAPSGVDAFVACEPGDEDAHRLARAICDACGTQPSRGTPLDRVLEALRATSPLAVCLVLDDVHELVAGSSGAALIGALLRRLPSHAHVVLAGRSLPDIAVSRLVADGTVLQLDEATLAFTPAELQALTAGSGRSPDSVDGLGGWPALVRLTLATPLGASRRYLWDEVVSSLDPLARRALLVLGLAGSATAATLHELCGAPVDIDGLVATVPMVAPVGPDEVRAHQLWGEAVVRLMPADEVHEMRCRAVGLLLERGAVLRAGAIAAAAGDAALLARPAVALVRRALGAFPADTAARWLDAIPAPERSRPELGLLEAARRQALSVHDPAVGSLVEEAIAHAERTGDVDLQIAALSQAGVAAHARGDQLGLFELSQRARGLPGARVEPFLRLVVASVDAALAELGGDIEGGLRALDSLGDGPEPVEMGETAARFKIHLLLLAGRADEAVAVSDRYLGSSTDAHVQLMPAFARWLSGDPSALLGRRFGPDPDVETNDRFVFNYLVYAAVLFASGGEGDWLAKVDARLAGTSFGADTRDDAMLTVARAASVVIRHRDAAAVLLVEEYLGRHPLADPVSNVHLRRFLPYGYVLSPVARAAWDAERLGPSQIRAREVARWLLVARRRGLTRRDPLPDPGRIFTALPLPWAVELAALAELAKHAGGRRTIEWLADHLGAVVRDELRWLADNGTAPAAEGAGALLRAVPERPTVVARVEVIGPMRVLVGGNEIDHPDLHRARVRELLSVLVVEGAVSRDRLTDLLWHALDGAAASRNLRVTLTYLRRVLEGDGRAPAGSHVRVDRREVQIVRSDMLEVDLWEARDHLQHARRATAAGDVLGVEAALREAVALWRGDPLADLHRLDEYVPEREGLVQRLSDAALSLGERRLAAGDGTDAALLAGRALDASPYSERASRLGIAAHLQRHDLPAAIAAVARLRAALGELDLAPEPATEVLAHQVERQVTGRVVTGAVTSGPAAAGAGPRSGRTAG